MLILYTYLYMIYFYDAFFIKIEILSKKNDEATELKKEHIMTKRIKESILFCEE